MIVGTIAAAVSGYLAIAGLIAFVRRHSYDVFVAYRVLLGDRPARADRHRGPRRDVLTALRRKMRRRATRGRE